MGNFLRIFDSGSIEFLQFIFSNGSFICLYECVTMCLNGNQSHTIAQVCVHLNFQAYELLCSFQCSSSFNCKFSLVFHLNFFLLEFISISILNSFLASVFRTLSSSIGPGANGLKMGLLLQKSGPRRPQFSLCVCV